VNCRPTIGVIRLKPIAPAISSAPESVPSEDSERVHGNPGHAEDAGRRDGEKEAMLHASLRAAGI
jgi:hypothetical protein